MKRILSLTMVGLLVFAAPIALAQKPGKPKDEGQDQQGQPLGGRNNPRPQPAPPRPTPQPPPRSQPRELPKTVDGGKNQGQPQGEPRRFNPPPRNPENPTPGKSFGQPSGGNSGKTSGQPEPRRLGPPDPRTSNQPQGKQSDPGNGSIPKRPDINPPSRGGNQPATSGNPRFPENNAKGGNPNAGGGKIPSTVTPGKTPDVTPPDRGGDEASRRRRPAPMSPSGKPGGSDVPAVKKGSGGNGGAPVESGLPNNSGPVAGRNPLGKPSQPMRGGNSAGEAAKTAGPARQTVPAIASNDVKTVSAPSKMQRLPQRKVVADNDGGSGLGPKPTFTPPPKKHYPKPVRQEFDAPQGGRVYRGNDYHHEYAHHHRSRSSWALGIGISDGSTSIAFGYNSGGCGYNPYACSYNPYYNPYWHPGWYAPVVYQPCCAVPVYSPVYYSPAYYPVVVDPWAYNSSSFAFGYSSFGGSALTSVSFAYSSSHWGLGFGWTSAPAYTIYTPVYDPYFRSVWVPGYYQIASERAWVPGSYEEVVSTPVVETVVDPLGNSYDAVTQPGSVDYVWKDGYWTIEDRRIWVPGHFEYVSAY